MIQKVQEVASISSKSATQEESEDSKAAHTEPDTLFKDGPLGLFLLSDEVQNAANGGQSYEVDIVFIHGLNGDPKRTWTHKNGTYWPEELLQRAMPGARIYSYGYPSRIFFSHSVAGIRDYAKNLLSCLMSERGDVLQRISRPIIYVCHSLGGIVLKEAMIIANDTEYYRSIWSYSKGVIFMGTPHRGSASASLGKILGDIANATLGVSGGRRLIGGIRTSLIQDLTQDSSELLRIADSFTRRAGDLCIVTFYETEKTPGAGTVIVGESSAVIGVVHEHPEPLWANHQDLCRFSGEDDKNYRLVAEALKRMTREILAEKIATVASVNTEQSYDESEKACVSVLNTTDVLGYESRLARRVEGTLQWVLTNNQYQSWMSSVGARILWVTGYAGCGKTTLASYIMRHLKEHLPRRAIVCRFFCDNKIKELRDANALLRSLIFQVIDRRKRLARLVRKASDYGGLQIFQQFDALWNIFVQIARDEKVSSMIVIIDALDECDETTQVMIIDRITELLRSANLPSLKFFITSRPNATALVALNIGVDKMVRLQLENQQDMISGDIKLMVHQRLEVLVKKGGCKPVTRDTLEDVLVSRADRTFLWISLVLPMLEERRVLSSLPPSEIRKIAEQIPPTLAELYDQMLSEIPGPDRDLAGQILRILVTSARDLNGDELGLLLTIGEQHQSMASLQERNKLYDAQTAQAALGSLIRKTDSKIELVHLSLKEYLIDLFMKPEHPLAAEFGVDLHRDTLALAATCMQYLSFDDFRKDIFAMSDSVDDYSPTSPVVPVESLETDEPMLFGFDLYEEPMLKDSVVAEAEAYSRIAERYKLFDYAARYWAADFATYSHLASSEQHEKAISLCADNTDCMGNWFRYFWISSGTIESYPSEVNPLVITSYFGQVTTLQRLIGSMEHAQNMASPALYWAARQGNASCVALLLKQTYIDPNHPAVEGESPVAAAAQYGHLDCILELFKDNRVNVNSKNRLCRTSLSLAAGNGHAQVVAAFLSRSDIIVDLPDRGQATPLFWAVAGNSVSVVRQFIADRRVNKNHLDSKGRNSLSWAAEDGLVDIVQEFIASNSINVPEKDMQGRSPLSYASQNGHLAVVKVLLKSKRSNILDQDNHGRNAMSWACEQGNAAVVQALLKHDRSCADVEDRDGWTPIAWAMNPPGYFDNIKILVRSGMVSINRKDQLNGLTPLGWAATYGHVEIARELISTKGIELEMANDGGSTPLSCAARYGNEEVVRLLIETGMVDLNSRSKNGRTPLLWAAAEGHCKVIAVLLSNAHVIVDARDEQGRLPQEIARVNGYEQAALDIENHNHS